VERTSQTIDLVDDNEVDLTCVQVNEELLKCGPFESATRKAAVVVSSRDQTPALLALASDVSDAGLSLRIKGVEFLLEPSSEDFRV
jgi:hypothetical protein